MQAYISKLASTKYQTRVIGLVKIAFTAFSRDYNIELGVIDELCSDFVFGLDFLRRHKEVILQFSGLEEPIVIKKHCCNLLVAKGGEIPRIFSFLDKTCKPIAAPSRRYETEDAQFIKEEVEMYFEKV